MRDSGTMTDPSYSSSLLKRKPHQHIENQRQSVDTLQRKLYHVDEKTSELHRALRQCQKDIWVQTLEEKHNKRKLCKVLCNSDFAPQISRARAEEICALERKIEDLSGGLAEARGQEARWWDIAQKQRAFYAQNLPESQPGAALFKKHPAGVVFYAPVHQPRYEDEGYDRLDDVHDGDHFDESFDDEEEDELSEQPEVVKKQDSGPWQQGQTRPQAARRA